MQPNVVAVGPLEDSSVLEVAIEGLVPKPCRRLHPKISLRITVVVGALDLVGVLHIAIVSLDAFARQEMTWVGTFQPDKVSLEDVDPQLVPERGLARILVGTKGIPLLGDPLLLDVEVSAIDRHQTIV